MPLGLSEVHLFPGYIAATVQNRKIWSLKSGLIAVGLVSVDGKRTTIAVPIPPLYNDELQPKVSMAQIRISAETVRVCIFRGQNLLRPYEPSLTNESEGITQVCFLTFCRLCASLADRSLYRSSSQNRMDTK